MASVCRSRYAFSRVFARKNSQILNNSTDFGRILHPESLACTTISKNYSSYSKSPFVDRIKEKYNYEVAEKPLEWTYVARLMPFDTIPKVTPKESYPSGWKPPTDESKELPYFIPRTKDHLLPIYLNLTYRGSRKISKISKIEGDIWLLNDEIKQYLKNKNQKYIETRVHEFAHFIEVKGDYIIDLQKWALSKGF